MKVERRLLVTEYAGRRKAGNNVKAQNLYQGTPRIDQRRSDQFGWKMKKRRERVREEGGGGGEKDTSGNPDAENQNLIHP